MMQRRGFLFGLSAMLAMPVVIRTPGLIMPVKAEVIRPIFNGKFTTRTDSRLILPGQAELIGAEDYVYAGYERIDGEYEHVWNVPDHIIRDCIAADAELRHQRLDQYRKQYWSDHGFERLNSTPEMAPDARS